MTPLYFVLSVLFLLQASIKDAKSDEACHVTQFYQVDVAVEICDVIVLENLFVPGGETLNLLLKDNTTVYFSGNITFGYYEWEGPLIAINATNAVIEGKDGALKYGVNVQQNYRNQPANSGSTLDPENNIPILNLDLINVDGNVADSATPVYILCADEGCYNWKFEDVSIIGSKESNCNYEPSDYYC
ncbi:hypothetical protein HUJ04_010405 [Dendroctonus ponderosae]|nr:hypothetical protein HUJ04_010405 [Dendroctonus ponderosae]